LFFFPLSLSLPPTPKKQGETGANVLVGVQIESSEMDEFHHRANNLGYDYVVVTYDNDFQLLMH
jgi:threonine dehydratase